MNWHTLGGESAALGARAASRAQVRRQTQTAAPGSGLRALSSTWMRSSEKAYRGQFPTRVWLGIVRVMTWWRAFNRVGGDDGTVFPSRKGQVFLCMSDVTAHGIASVLFVAHLDSYVRDHVTRKRNPARLWPAAVAEELDVEGPVDGVFAAACEIQGERGRDDFRVMGVGVEP